MQNHSENIKNLNRTIIYEKLTSQQKDILDKRNKNRQEEKPVDPNKPLYEKKFSQDIKKLNKYEKVITPIQDHQNIIISNKRKIHKKNLKPQRFLVSDGATPSTAFLPDSFGDKCPGSSRN